MLVKKTYRDVRPELLYDEIRDLTLKQGILLKTAEPEMYAVPGDTASFVFRGTMTFTAADKVGNSAKECLRVHVLGSDKGETKVIFDINEELFPPEKLNALQDELDFMFSTYEENS
jgi:hypothetical protein